MQQHSDGCYSHQKAAARQQSGSMEDHLAGHVDVDAPLPVAGHRQGEQRGYERRRDRPPESEAVINPAASDERV